MAGATNRKRRVNSRSGQNRRIRTEYYEDGNAVRKLEPLLPEEETDARPVRRPPHKVSRQVRANRARVKTLGIGYVLFLAAVCSATIFFCFQFLQVRTAYIHQTQQIASLETTLSELKADNDAYYKQTLDSVDMEDVKTTALEDLGMQYPSESQIKYYDTAEESYVRQYRDLS